VAVAGGRVGGLGDALAHALQAGADEAREGVLVAQAEVGEELEGVVVEGEALVAAAFARELRVRRRVAAKPLLLGGFERAAVHARRRASFLGPLGWPFWNTHKQNESNEMMEAGAAEGLFD